MKKIQMQRMLLVVFLSSTFLAHSMMRLLSPSRANSFRSSLSRMALQNKIPESNPHFPDIKQVQPQPLMSSGIRSSIKPLLLTTLSWAMLGSEVVMFGLLLKTLKDFWSKSKGPVSSLGSGKLTFAEKYHNGNRIAQSGEELFARLEQLAALRSSQAHTLIQHHAHEEQVGDKNQAVGWLFGNMYRYALDNARNIADIILLYEAAAEWVHLRVENGLHNTIDDLNAEFDRVMRKENEIMNLYDEKSRAMARQYLSDMRKDLSDEFIQRLDEHQASETPQE